jgi:hypothetical protein
VHQSEPNDDQERRNETASCRFSISAGSELSRLGIVNVPGICRRHSAAVAVAVTVADGTAAFLRDIGLPKASLVAALEARRQKRCELADVADDGTVCLRSQLEVGSSFSPWVLSSAPSGMVLGGRCPPNRRCPQWHSHWQAGKNKYEGRPFFFS